MLEKFANIEIKESKLLPAKICEPCSQLLKASRVLQANIFEANEEWEDIYARKCYLTTAGLSRIQDRVERSATRLYDYFNEDDEVHEYNEIVVQRVKVIQDLQNCGGCLTPFNRFPKKNIEESLQAQVTEPTSNENEDDDDEEVEPEVNHPHQLCFDCVENLEKTLTVVKNCRRVNLNGWRVSQCLLCREEKRLQGGGNAPKNLRDFAIMWNEQNSAEKIALSSSYICKSCQLRLTDAMKFRYHILKIEEALIPHGESKWNGYTDDPGTRSRIYTFVEQASALLEPKKKEVKKTYEPDNVETVDNSAAIVAYDHEFDFEWNKVPVSYDSDSSDTDIETFQLNQPFYQKFIQCDECHKEIHELDYELHKETHEWSGRKCHYCDEEMKISSTLVSHILRRHKKYKGFLCEICGVALFSANCFLAHTNRIHPTKMVCILLDFIFILSLPFM